MCVGVSECKRESVCVYQCGRSDRQKSQQGTDKSSKEKHAIEIFWKQTYPQKKKKDLKMLHIILCIVRSKTSRI